MEFETTLTFWARKHPELLKLDRLGESESGLGIHLLKITDSSVEDRFKQVVLVTSLHGGPERSGTTTALHFVEWLLGDSEEARETRRNQGPTHHAHQPSGGVLSDGPLHE